CGGAEPAGGAAAKEPALQEAEEPARQEAEAIDLKPIETDETLSDVEKRLEAAAAEEDDEPLELDRDEEAEARARELRKRMLQQGLRNRGIAPQAKDKEVVDEPRRTPTKVEPVDPAIRAFVEEVQQRVAELDQQN